MKVKGQYTISLEEAKRLKDNGYDVKPGLKVCRNCHEQVLQSNEANTDFPLDLDEDDPLESTSKDYPLDQDDNLDLDVSREELNLSLQCSGVSPLKLHGATKSRQISTAKNKLSRFQKYHTEKAAKVLGVSTDAIEKTGHEQEEHGRMVDREKASELDKLHFLLKEKIANSTRRDKIKYLTLAPDSWSRAHIASFFIVTEYQVRASRKLKREKGILEEPESKLGKSLPEATISLVKEFYEDDEYSRMMPSKKDFVSIGRN